MTQILDFDLGKKSYQLGKNGPTIELVTNDVNLPARLTEAFTNIEKHIPEMQKEYGISDISINDIGSVSTGDIEKDVEFIKKADEYVKEQINYIFGYNVSPVVFGNISSFTVDRNTGEYLFEKLINTFVPVINEEYGTSLKQLKSRIQKFTDKKGMHPALRK